jgi:formylglycine-generating enzyme required for sulfatase activity
MFQLAPANLAKLAAVTGIAGLVVTAGMSNWRITTLDAGSFARVRVDQGKFISVGVYEVTWRQWKACHDDKGCAYLPKKDLSGQKDDYPVTGVNHFDVGEYLQWINRRTGQSYRLPSTKEWNAISGGLSRQATKKLFTDPRMAWAADYGAMETVSKKLQPSGSFGSNASGIADLSGNVWEWSSTCAKASMNDVDCPAYIVEGLHEGAVSIFIRDPSTGGCALGVPPSHVGFRLVMDD